MDTALATNITTPGASTHHLDRFLRPSHSPWLLLPIGADPTSGELGLLSTPRLIAHKSRPATRDPLPARTLSFRTSAYPRPQFLHLAATITIDRAAEYSTHIARPRLGVIVASHPIPRLR